MLSFKIVDLLVLENKIFKGFFNKWTWRPSWSCDLDHLYKLLALISQAVFETVMFENNGHIHGYSQILAIFDDCTAQFVSDLVGNPVDRFSHIEAHLTSVVY